MLLVVVPRVVGHRAGDRDAVGLMTTTLPPSFA
jgi:hypothetical protein